MSSQYNNTGLWIPSEIWENKNLTIQEKLLLAVVHALYNKNYGGCFASNAFLAKELDAHVNSIANSLSKLRKMGFIEDVSFYG